MSAVPKDLMMIIDIIDTPTASQWIERARARLSLGNGLGFMMVNNREMCLKQVKVVIP